MTYCTDLALQGNTNTLVSFGIGGRWCGLSSADLMSPENQNQVREACRVSPEVCIADWDQILYWPESHQDFIISLISEDPGKYQVSRSGSRDFYYPDIFEATLAVDLPQGNLQMAASASRFAVSIARMMHPHTAEYAAQQIREWLTKNGITPEPKRTLAAQIRRADTTTGNSVRVTPQEGGRRVLADLQAQREERGEVEIDTPPIYFLNQEFYQWTGKSWELIKNMLVLITQILQRVVPDQNLSAQYINSVYANVKALTLVAMPSLRLPVCITNGEQREFVSCQYLTFQNGMLDLTPIEMRERLTLSNHDPRVFGSPCLEYNYDPNAECLHWQQVLSQILPRRAEDDDRLWVLQEFFGYCLLSNDFRHEKFMILIGNGANGKSVVLDVLRAVLGGKNVSHMPLDAMSKEFRIFDMIGKLANIASDMQRIDKVNEGTLKQLVSGEQLQVNRKHKEPVTMHPTAKLIFATNHLPSFSDVSDGLWRRMIVIPFGEQFRPEQRDLGLARRLIQSELPGILNWAIEGARRLVVQDRFTQCGECERAGSVHRYDSDPFRQFLDECCVVGSDFSVDTNTLFRSYENFCRDNGRRPKSNTEIGKQLKNLKNLPGIERIRDTRQQDQTGVRAYYYQGISLRSQIPYRSR